MTVRIILRIMLVSQKTLTFKNPSRFVFCFALSFMALSYYEIPGRAKAWSLE